MTAVTEIIHNDDCPRWMIVGKTVEGKKFRPSDWAERMCGQLSTFRNRRIYYSPLLRPAIKDGIKCVIVDKQLAAQNIQFYEELIQFVTNNELMVEARH